jgi:hypothetical protein
MASQERANNDGMTFEQWKARVNKEVIKIAGLSCDDFADWDYYSAFRDEYTPKQAAREALEEAGFPFE